MKLRLEHIAPYLPYKVNIYGSSDIFELTGIIGQFSLGEIFVKCKNHSWIHEASMFEHSLILRPLSDLSKDIEVNGEKFIALEKIIDIYPHVEIIKCKDIHGNECYYNETSKTSNIKGYEFAVVQLLFEWHFDVFSLIDKELAVNINLLS